MDGSARFSQACLQDLSTLKQVSLSRSGSLKQMLVACQISRNGKRSPPGLLPRPAQAAAGVTEVTLWRWQKQPHFHEAYMVARWKVVKQAMANIQNTTSKAVAFFLDSHEKLTAIEIPRRWALAIQGQRAPRRPYPLTGTTVGVSESVHRYTLTVSITTMSGGKATVVYSFSLSHAAS
jgi:hypothetical protein